LIERLEIVFTKKQKHEFLKKIIAMVINSNIWEDKSS